jgi:nickel-dependent lactate racemase
VADTHNEAERSLSDPTVSPRLSELAKAGQKIALVIDDGSRPTPVAKVLPAVLAELLRGGASLEQVTVVPALGVHRPMSGEEIGQRLGMGDLRVRWENPDCDDPHKLANLGITSRGTPVWINKTVAQADLVLSIGCIEPHIIASFGGGYKNLIPGVAGRETIAHNHCLNATPATFNMVGQPIENNPMRLDLEEGGRMLKPPVFLVNAVLNSALEVVRVVCGDPVAAHRAGVKVSASIYGVKLPGLADVVITDSHPMDSDLRQGVKALANTTRAVRPGGVMLTLVKANEGVGVFGLAERKLPVSRGGLKLLAPLLLPLVPKLKLKNMSEEERLFLYFALQAMRRATLLLYGPSIPEANQKNLLFVEFVKQVQAGIQRAAQKFPGQAEVVVFPYGGSTYPIVADD